MTIDLTPFCSVDRTRHALLEPFNKGDFTYASDGRILVRVAKRDGFKDGTINAAQIGTYAPLGKEYGIPVLPPVPPIPPCEVCAGTGKTCVCPDCHGEGTTECEKCGQDEDCDTCDGTGSVGAADNPNSGVTCYECEGSGLGSPVLEPIAIGPASFAAPYLRKIAALPNHKMWVVSEFDPAFFTFDGGCGYLMSLRMK